MQNAHKLRNKLRQGTVCLGTGITCTDPTITEALCSLSDFVWIDMEHNALSLETVQGHILATTGTDTAALVRVAWNDPVLIKPVLDIGADGIIAPMVRTAEEARRAVAACKYPPEGIRGYGPRRPSGYGRLGGPEYCRQANESIIVIIQIEHIEAVRNVDEILAVPGVTSVLVGPNDLAGSMGLMGQPDHPEVLSACETVVARAMAGGVVPSVAVGGGPAVWAEWARRGAQWITFSGDIHAILAAATDTVQAVRERLAQRAAPGGQP
jgi:2-dehydro-3-deoxyglucarate aldolase/4-hydroxy-2-oxoheptanedioate aldolase